MIQQDDAFWMRMAVDVAKEGSSRFGAVLVDEEGQQVSAFNTTALHGPTAHAEINVINRMKELDYDSPEDLILYTTVEPCPMCMSAIIWAGIGSVKFGLSIEEASAYVKQIHITSHEIIKNSWRHVVIEGGLEKDRCLQLFTGNS